MTVPTNGQNSLDMSVDLYRFADDPRSLHWAKQPKQCFACTAVFGTLQIYADRLDVQKPAAMMARRTATSSCMSLVRSEKNTA